MKIEFTEEVSYTKYHYGTLTSDIGNEYEFTLIETYDSTPNTTEFEVVWPDGPPHQYKALEKEIIQHFNTVEL